MIKVNVWRIVGTCSHGDDDLAGFNRGAVVNFNQIRIHELRVTTDDFDFIATVELSTHVLLLRADFGCSRSQLGDRGIGFDAAVNQQRIVERFSQSKDRKAKGFAGNRTPVCATTPDFFIAFYKGDFLASLGTLHGGTFTTWSRADYNNIGFPVSH